MRRHPPAAHHRRRHVRPHDPRVEVLHPPHQHAGRRRARPPHRVGDDHLLPRRHHLDHRIAQARVARARLLCLRLHRRQLHGRRLDPPALPRQGPRLVRLLPLPHRHPLLRPPPPRRRDHRTGLSLRDALPEPWPRRRRQALSELTISELGARRCEGVRSDGGRPDGVRTDDHLLVVRVVVVANGFPADHLAWCQRRDGGCRALPRHRAARAAGTLYAAVRAAALHARALGSLGVGRHDAHAAPPPRLLPHQALPAGRALLAVCRLVPAAPSHDDHPRARPLHVDPVQHRDQVGRRDECPLRGAGAQRAQHRLDARGPRYRPLCPLLGAARLRPAVCARLPEHDGVGPVWGGHHYRRAGDALHLPVRPEGRRHRRAALRVGPLLRRGRRASPHARLPRPRRRLPRAQVPPQPAARS
mmetsp:Transcript_40848/g.119266  ORF Transcript_40848/g.119266 Transcript_40848/m.119266 type:complete len:416 (+) Transcript_40848:68-1315(+)